jgi:hypothetical protein
MRIALIIGALLASAACSAQPASEPAEPAPVVGTEVELASVSTPASGARVTSPLQVSGVAPANWFFENQFPVRLIDANGVEIAFAPAHPRVSWTDPGPKEFDAELSFSVTGAATLVLERDMPRGGNEAQQVRIPVVLE